LKNAKEWPEVDMPEEMDAEELEHILLALGMAYNRLEQFPPVKLAPALGLKSPVSIRAWLRGERPVPPWHAKLLRLFHAIGRVS